MKALKRFFDSPANRTGLALWLGTAITAFLQHFLLHMKLPPADLLGIILGLVKILQPENTVTVAQMQKAMTDLTVMLRTKNPADLETVVKDAEGLVAGVLAHKAKA